LAREGEEPSKDGIKNIEEFESKGPNKGKI